MFENMNEAQARAEILKNVREYVQQFHNIQSEFKPGDRINYASRVYGPDDVEALVDSSLDFWLTAGRYTQKFERDFAQMLGVKYCSVVNSGSSANLIAFSALTSPLLGNRRIVRGDEVITVACAFPTTVTPIIQYGVIPVFVD
ncbi:MAG: DegT/DnrJ/EryC1/StrS family aminotransferase, partial [Clostridia bacterium]